MRRARGVRLVIFDCDGVLVDSEPVAREVLRVQAARIGWAIDPFRFTGHRLDTLPPVHLQETGRALPDGWLPALEAALLSRLSAGVPLVDGALAALRAIAALGVPVRIASNSSHAEMARKFADTPLARFSALGRQHSAGDVGKGKPAPDLFLAAADAEGVPAEETLVVEDSPPGVTAAIAAGMACVGYAPHGDGARLAALGATTFHDMAELPALVQGLMAAEAAG